MFLFQVTTTIDQIDTATSTNAMQGMTETFNNLGSYVSGFNFAEPTWDLFIILFFLLASFVYGLTLGRDRIILILISIYMSLAVIGAAPFLEQIMPQELDPNNTFLFNISVFLGIFVFLFFMLSRSVILRTISKSDAPGGWWQVIVFSILHVGLLMSITLSFIPEEHYNQLSDVTKEWFVGDEAGFFWIVMPIIAMGLISGKKKDKV